MNNKVSLGVSGPGGGCTGCVSPNVPWTPRRLEEGGGFWSPPTTTTPRPLRGAKMFGECQGQGLHLGAPQGASAVFIHVGVGACMGACVIFLCVTVLGPLGVHLCCVALISTLAARCPDIAFCCWGGGLCRTRQISKS